MTVAIAKRTWRMQTDWIIAITALGATALTGLIGAIIRSVSTNRSDTITQENTFRRDILMRVGQLEENQEYLTKELNKYKTAYWQLYEWVSRTLKKNNINIEPPTFHDQYKEDQN